jgi:hypothetical protein
MEEKEWKAYQQGVVSGENGILVNLIQSSDKYNVIDALFSKANELYKAETDPVMKARLDGYSEGFRHALNILDNMGSALEAYQNVYNPSITVPLTQEDVDKL